MELVVGAGWGVGGGQATVDFFAWTDLGKSTRVCISLVTCEHFPCITLYCDNVVPRFGPVYARYSKAMTQVRSQGFPL